MEQEVKVTIHRSEAENRTEEPPQQDSIPHQLEELGEILSDSLSSFRESDAYDWILESTEKTRQYIKKNPARSMLLSLGAGILFGLFIKKGR